MIKTIFRWLARIACCHALVFAGSAFALDSKDCGQNGGAYECLNGVAMYQNQMGGYSSPDGKNWGPNADEVCGKFPNLGLSDGKYLWGIPGWGEGCEYRVTSPPSPLPNGSLWRAQNWAYRAPNLDTCPKPNPAAVLHPSWTEVVCMYPLCPYPGQEMSASAPQICLTRLPPPYCPPCEAKLGNPIYPLTGAKKQPVPTGFIVGGIELVLAYDTTRRLNGFDSIAPAAAGELWSSNLHKKLAVGGNGVVLTAFRGNGTIVSFVLQAGVYGSEADINDRVVAIAGGGYRYTDAATKALETYDAQGRLTGIQGTDGSVLTFTYSTAASGTAPAAGYLMQVSDNNGRSINFQYTLPAGSPALLAPTRGLMTTATHSSGRSVQFAYDGAGNLKQLTWPDGKTLQFLYENTAFPWALTGRVDESGSRDATWGYDSDGRAVSTTLAGGADAFSVSYQQPPAYSLTRTEDRAAGLLYLRYDTSAPAGVAISMPNGQSSSWSSAVVGRLPLLTAATQPAGSGCTASSSARSHDGSGNVLSRDDFAGQRVCYGYDASNRETVRVEGLGTSVACSGVIGAGATLPAGARKITTSWHADWRLPVQVDEPLKRTTTVYHGQPDPFNGGATANCTSAAAMSNGKALPLVCKRVEQALTAGGAVDGTVAANTTSYTYDAAGRMLTSTDANNRTTSYAYYASTSFTGVDPDAIGHTVGDLQTVTNAAGHVEQYTQYDKAGRVRQSVDAKGVVTDIVYTARGWVSTVTVTPPGGSARTTSYAYDNAGQRTGVSLPDGTALSYSYDAAHRLVGVTDARGNAVTYTLDAAGNRVGEEVRDPMGSLQRAISRSFDALNRLQQVSGAAM